MLAGQLEDGTFGTPKENAEKSLLKYGPETAFALLFLRKANLGSDVAKLVKPDPESPFVIVETGRVHKTLMEAVEEAKPNETIRVEGDGPFKLAGAVIDKPVKIVAAGGYEPLFLWERPKVRGFDADLATHPQYRTMLVIKASKTPSKTDGVEFEGIRFRMDPPSGVDGPFVALRCEGTQVAFCSCSFTTQQRNAGTLLEVVDSPRFLVRNSFVVGFSPVFKAISNQGKTERGTRMGLQDSIVYSPALLEASGTGSLDFFLLLSSVHSSSVFNIGALTGPSSFIVENNALRSQQLFADMGQGSVKWTGQKNLYDIDTWVEKGGPSQAARLRTVDDWLKMWQGSETKSATGSAFFEVNRQQVASFRHNLNPRDWTVKSEVVRRSMNVKDDDQIGANEAFVGPGDILLRFRELADYATWQKIRRPSREN
jgi:hypothetical protein